MPKATRIVCLSNVFDQHYQTLRGEKIAPCLSSPKRRDLFRCLELATDREIVVLSSPPKSLERRTPRWLPAVTTKFSTHRQLFCTNWDAPKVRIPLSWFFYAVQAVRHIRTGDLVVVDNYEFLYLVAAYAVRLFRRVTFVLDYEDGKHLIDRSWARVLSGCAEWLGRRIIRAAILVNPGMKNRLPPGLPTTLVPGFVTGTELRQNFSIPAEIRFLYSGTLDKPRGVDILLKALEHLPDSGWRLDITGSGPLENEVKKIAVAPRFAHTVSFHKTLPEKDYQRLVASAHVGLNCQRSSDPISGVTFPSKIFTYVSAGLVVLSSTASEVKSICGDACHYFEEETPEALARAIRQMVQNPEVLSHREEADKLAALYGIEGTALRLNKLLSTIRPSDW